jgi:hypothetical protein
MKHFVEFTDTPMTRAAYYKFVAAVKFAEAAGEARMLRRVKAQLRKTGWRSALLALKPLTRKRA